MAENSNIEWTDHTFNPWIGCSKVSQGCANCYAETLMDTRYGRVKWGVHGTRVRTSEDNWKKPLQWDRKAKKLGIRQRVFCASLADVFEDRPELVQWRADLFRLIDATPNLDWLLLTKRPENIARMWREVNGRGWLDDRRENVSLGTSIEDQSTADRRVPELLKAGPLCSFLFLSCEPLLGPVYIDMIPDALYCAGMPFQSNRLVDGVRINWVIAGGESGPGARPMNPKWVRSLRDQCSGAGVPFLFKQWGEWLPAGQGKATGIRATMVGDGCEWQQVGKKAAGRLLDGQMHSQTPFER